MGTAPEIWRPKPSLMAKWGRCERGEGVGRRNGLFEGSRKAVMIWNWAVEALKACDVASSPTAIHKIGDPRRLGMAARVSDCWYHRTRKGSCEYDPGSSMTSRVHVQYYIALHSHYQKKKKKNGYRP